MYYKTAGFQYDLNKYSFFIFFYEKVHLKLLLFVHGVHSERSFSTRCQFKMIGCPSILILLSLLPRTYIQISFLLDCF